MFLTTSATRHQRVTEIDQAAAHHEGKENRLLQAYGMRHLGAFFQDGSGPHLCPAAHRRPIQKDRPVEIPTLQRHPFAQLAVFNGRRGLPPQYAARPHARMLPE